MGGWSGQILQPSSDDSFLWAGCGNMMNVVINLVRKATKHQKSVHIGIRYQCEQCASLATTNNGLTKHLQSVQLGKIICERITIQCI